jgi:hypothetical protein
VTGPVAAFPEWRPADDQAEIAERLAAKRKIRRRHAGRRRGPAVIGHAEGEFPGDLRSSPRVRRSA